jgi:glycosyltransferase involved in cell wall biosynthesis
MASAGQRHAAPRCVSVIVPVRDGAETIAEQLAALSAQTYEGPWELIVADNGSTDATRAIVEQWTSRLPRVTVVEASAQRGPAFARTRGAQTAGGDFLAFCDADDVVVPEWLASLVEAARDFDIVTGVLEAGDINDPAVQSWRPSRARGLPRAGFLPFAPSGNLGVWATVFAATGGFDDAYEQSEDVEWSWRAQLDSYTLGFAPGAIVHYRYRTSTRGVARQAYVAGRSAVQLFRDFRDRGMPRPPIARALRRWAWLVLRAPYLLSGERRNIWIRRAGVAVGRVAGNVKYRVWCP